ncbi:kinesin-like protein KIN-7L [Dioscorea cayenensis subsp. rotundata]|uniref:Kinesin-like protein n=1 Tax=Dioscorea cayennensis subsp. rotundata TaxID=55577 RepID=A0AB40CI08_DIOCR|nr:kinesin-like protein KIN-7L [Dioscorea cayenensis subsp. rotundata]
MEKISVAVRFRPSTSDPLPSDRQWHLDDNRISLHRPLGTPNPTSSSPSFSFDHVFDHSTTNSSVHQVLTSPIILAAVDGFNGTVFAYGQTSSGKTYTMNGSGSDPGIIQLAVRDVFEMIQMVTEREFLIRVSYMEIYNEEINDLLVLGNQKLPIHESLERGVYVAGLREEIVNNTDQVLELIKLGETNRHFGETNMNARSSRSHTIFRMVIESSVKNTTSSGDVSDTDAIRVSVLNLVDLAGSERIAKTGAGGVRLKEGKHINKSLMVLGNVINKLSEGKQRAHIPYRDSKLTRILQPALGGNAKTSIICTVAPEEVHVEETKGTLQFASRAKRITNCAQVNEVLTDAALLRRQKLEIEELRKKLQGSHSEVLEQVILKQRNDMLKSEMERDKLATQLEEERKARETLENHIKEQQKKIENLNDLSFSSGQTQNSCQVDSGEISKHVFNGNNGVQLDVFKTPNFKSMPNNFVMKRSVYSSAIESSPIPDSFDSIADEDMWLRLNKGLTTDLDTLDMTPFRNNQFLSQDASLEHALEETSTEETSSQEADCSLHKQELEASKEICAKLENECKLLREQNASLVQTLSMSKENVELLTAEKEELLKNLNIEKQKLKDLKDEIRQFSLAFAQREGLLTSLYSKSKAMVENLKSCRAPIPEILEC